MRPREVERTRAAYRDGVDGIGAVAGRIEGDAWEAVVCGTWTASQVVRHLVGVVGWYHDWLDAADAGRPRVPFPTSDLDARTAAALEAVGPMTPEEAVTTFSAEAGRYLERLDEVGWGRAYGYPGGIVTAGLHAGIAAVEWHVHAWDLSLATGSRHVPARPGDLFRGAAAAQAAISAPLVAPVLRALTPIGARRRPWATLLARVGRDPDA